MPQVPSWASSPDLLLGIETSQVPTGSLDEAPRGRVPRRLEVRSILRGRR